ncbi:unnamed protein product [Orchesella dallaii]|uniref:G-protein coupled receptors family 2 profile 2 domain-containing protein n=1 Tax=Orchesella dallaii TaxID=48710 RepID=A0ABP1Q7Z1_9HEXA
MEIIRILRNSASLLIRFPLTKVLLLVIVFDHLATAQEEPSQGHQEVSHTYIAVCSESVLQTILSREISQYQRKTNGIFWTPDENIWQAPPCWISTNDTQKFMMHVTKPICADSSVVKVYLESGDECENGTTTHFYPNGYFRNGKDIYAPDEYCIERFSEDPEDLSVNITLCKPNCKKANKRPCIRKCCPLDRIFVGTHGKPFCSSLPSGSTQFMPTLYHDFYNEDKSPPPTGLKTVQPDNSSSLMPHFILNHPKYFKKKCTDAVVLALPSSDTAAKILSTRFPSSDFHSMPFRIRKNGELMHKKLENKCDTIKNQEHICIDGIRGVSTINSGLDDPFRNTQDEYIIFHCNEDKKDGKLDTYKSFIFGVLLLVTSVFPLITSVVYLLLWKRQNVHGWTICCTSASLFFMYIFQGIAHLLGVLLEEAVLNTFICQLIGIFTHFFMMATFTWLTVMSCDLWLTFRSVVPMNQRLQGVPRFIKYSLFGWGVPIVIVTIGVLMDYVIAANDCNQHVVPGYGQQNCGILEANLGEYLYYPGAVLICINVSLFAATCLKLCMYRGGPGSRTKKNDPFGECFSRFTKLFLVMGVSWIFEIVSWQVDGLGFTWYWTIFDLFNILRAVAVFAVYVCKKDIFKQLEDTYPSIKQISRPFSNLFFRKCADQISMESTKFSDMPHSHSPVIPLKARNAADVNGSVKSQKSVNALEVPTLR